MAHAARIVTLIVFALVLAPTASAGTAEQPELTDPPGDCSFAPANHYADIVAAWISGETATSFDVNLALAEFSQPQLAEMSGYTVQFEHQGKQFGVVAFYWQGQWEFSTGFVNTDTGEASDFSDAEGTFTAGTPAIITVSFDKALFPHDDPNDNALRAFHAGTADFKPYAPFFFVPAALPVAPPFLGACDTATSDATYTFGTGDHSGHGAATGGDAGAPMGNATGSDADAGAANGTTGDGVAQLADQQGAGGNDTPGPSLALVAIAAAGAALARRRRVS